MASQAHQTVLTFCAAARRQLKEQTEDKNSHIFSSSASRSDVAMLGIFMKSLVDATTSSSSQ